MLQPYVYADGTLNNITALGDVNVILVMAETPYDADRIVRMQQSYNPSGGVVVNGSFQHFQKVEFTGATWAEPGRTITLAGAFTRYAGIAQDNVVYITAGTGAIQGPYIISARNSNDQITLAAGQDINGAGGGIADVAGFILRGRAITRLEWTVLDYLSVIPLPASNETGGSLSKGSAYEASQPGVVLEQRISA